MNMHAPVLERMAAHAATSATTPITVAFGDGIGPEIMAASLKIMLAAGARIAVEPIEIGESVYRRGNSAGIDKEAWESLRRTGVFFKAPITTPQGGGFKSLNVTVRKSLGLFANLRPCVAYAPFVATKHPAMDIVIVRENEEDLYAGIEHRQTDEVVQCLKLVSLPGTERIVRYAFDYARANGRRKVSCFTKDNIMKMTDGLFHRVFEQIGAEYPEIEKEHLIVDIGAARIADTPEQFDVVVLPNLYGDILSDVAAQIAGSVGMAASANVGLGGAMFEAIHGSAPALAGHDVANPSGLLLAGVMMLRHIGQADVAARIHNAWLATIEAGLHTADVFTPGVSAAKLGTRAFADAVIARLGQTPKTLAKVEANADGGTVPIPAYVRGPAAQKTLLGVDVFVHWMGDSPDALADALTGVPASGLALAMITNRGVKVWPAGLPETFCTDHWRCRFMIEPGLAGNGAMVAALLGALVRAGIEVIKTENLYAFDGAPGFSLGQGQ